MITRRCPSGLRGLLLLAGASLLALAGCSDPSATGSVFTTTPPPSGSWSRVGAPGFSSDAVEEIASAIAPDGTPWVLFQDYGGTGARVMKFDGTNWVTVGPFPFSAGFIGSPSIAFSPTGVPYVAFQDTGTGVSPAVVMTFDGTNWVPVGGGIVSPDTAPSVSLGFDPSGNLYVAFQDSLAPPFNVVLMKYTAGAWTPVPCNPIAGFNPSNNGFTSLAFEPDGTPVVAFTDSVSSSGITVMRYSGGNTSPVGMPGFSAGSASDITLRIDKGGTPYVAFEDSGYGLFPGAARVMKFVASQNAWVPVGGATVSSGTASYTSLCLDASGIPVIAFQDQNASSYVTVMKYRGPDWRVLGQPGFNGEFAVYVSIALSPAGAPFVAYRNNPASVTQAWTFR